MASLQKIPDKYYIRYYDESGKRKNLPLNTTDKRIANQKLKEFEAAQTLGIAAQSGYKRIPGFITLSDALEQFKNSRIMAPKTSKLYKNAIDSFISVNTDSAVIRYEKKNFYAWQNKMLENKKSKNTIAIYSRHLHALWNWLISNKIVEENIIGRVTGEKKEVVIIPREDLKIILYNLTPEQVLTIKWLLYTGMRVGEAVLVRTRNIDLKNKIIKFRNVKAKRFEQLPIIKPVGTLLKTANLTREYLLQHHTYNAVRLFWERKIEILTTKITNDDGTITPPLLSRKYTLHQLRKTCGTILANSGVKPIFLRDYMRHDNIATTLEYYRLAELHKMNTDIDQNVNWNDAL